MVKFKSFEFEEISHGGRLKLNESPEKTSLPDSHLK